MTMGPSLCVFLSSFTSCSRCTRVTVLHNLVPHLRPHLLVRYSHSRISSCALSSRWIWTRIILSSSPSRCTLDAFLHVSHRHPLVGIRTRQHVRSFLFAVVVRTSSSSSSPIYVIHAGSPGRLAVGAPRCIASTLQWIVILPLFDAMVPLARRFS